MLFLLEAKSPMKETQVRYGPEGPVVRHEHIFSYFMPSWWLIFPLISAIIGIILFICVISEEAKILEKQSYAIFFCIFCYFLFGFPIIIHSMLPGTGHKIATVVLFFLTLVFFYCTCYYLSSDEKDEDKKIFIDLCVWLMNILVCLFSLYSLLLIIFMIFKIGYFKN